MDPQCLSFVDSLLRKKWRSLLAAQLWPLGSRAGGHAPAPSAEALAGQLGVGVGRPPFPAAEAAGRRTGTAADRLPARGVWPRPGTDVTIFKKSFRRKNWRKYWRFFLKLLPVLEKNDHNIGFLEKDAIFSAENCDHNIDPWSRLCKSVTAAIYKPKNLIFFRIEAVTDLSWLYVKIK
jgi:hypothetical protein